MKVRVLFFGATADAVGTREIEIDLEDETKAAAAFTFLVEISAAKRAFVAFRSQSGIRKRR